MTRPTLTDLCRGDAFIRRPRVTYGEPEVVVVFEDEPPKQVVIGYRRNGTLKFGPEPARRKYPTIEQREQRGAL